MASNERPNYSTLEVAPTTEQGLQVVPNEYAQAQKQCDNSVSSDQSLPQVVPGQGHSPQYWPDKALPPPRRKRICGLAPRTFWILAGVGLLCVVGAVVGGTYGSISTRKNTTSNGDGSGNTGGASSSSSVSSSNATQTVLANSQLAATNWTDSVGTAYHALFYQDAAGDLIFSLWTSVDKTWNASRIVDLVPASSRASIQAQNATALAAAARGYPWTAWPWHLDYGISLFYLDSKDNIQQLMSTDPQGASWDVGTLSTSGRTYAANGDAQLAAWWDLCQSECDGEIWLFYQDDGQRIQFANSTDWTPEPYQLIGSGVASGTGLAVTAVANSVSGPINGPAVYYENSDKEMVEVYVDDYVWNPVGGPEATLPYPSPQMAAIGYANSTSDPGAVNNFLVVTLDSHGTLLTNHWDTNSWTTDLAPSLTGTSEDVFERIAMVAAEDLVLYGLTAEGAIKAFLIDRGDTSTWAFDSVVVAGSPS